MKSVSALLMLALLSLVLLSCGGTRVKSDPATPASAPGSSDASPTPIHSTSPEGYMNDGDNDVVGDADNDNNHDNDNDNSEDHKPNENGDYQDADDNGILAFGHSADAKDKQAITAVVMRYYALAAAGDAVGACAMLPPSFAKVVHEDYGQGSAGPEYLRSGNSCPGVMTLLFKHFHTQLNAKINVTGVRINGTKAVVLLASRAMPAGSLPVERRGSTWMIGAVLGSALP